MLSLHRNQGDEPDVEPVADAESAIKRIVQWPLLGTLDYAGPEGIVSISYLGESSIGLQCVMISAQQRSVDRTGSVVRYQELGAALHAELPAERTIMEWGLAAHGFRWMDEIERLRNGQFQGSYPLLDLRRA